MVSVVSPGRPVSGFRVGRLVGDLVAAEDHVSGVGAGHRALRVAQNREVLVVQHGDEDLDVLVPESVVAFLGHPAVLDRRADQTDLHPALLRIGRMRAEGEQLEVIRLPEQSAVGAYEVGFGGVLGEAAVAGILFDPAVDRLAQVHEPAMVTEVLEGHDVGVDVLGRGVRMRVLDVIAVQEGVLHELPVDGLLEDLDARGHERSEIVRGQDGVHLGAEPVGDVDGRLGVVHHPDEPVSLLGGQLHEIALVTVGLTEGVVAGDRAQRAVGVVRPTVVRAREQPATALFLLLDHGAAVTALVDEGLDAAVALADDDDVVPRHLQGEEVARLRDLGSVGDDRRKAAEDAVPLEFRDCRIDELVRFEPGEVLVLVGGVVAQMIECAANAFLGGNPDLCHGAVLQSRAEASPGGHVFGCRSDRRPKSN